MAFGPFNRYFNKKPEKVEDVSADVDVTDLFDGTVSDSEAQPSESAESIPADVAPAPVAEEPVPAAPSSTRVKTTFLGFDAESEFAELDELEEQATPDAQGSAPFPTGWLVVVDGPGRGQSFTLGVGVNSVGRSEDQQISLDFGDTNISREGHCFVAFDPDEQAFFAGQGGKSNLVRLNGQPLLSTERMNHGDQLKVGQTVLRLAALCDASFSWQQDDQ